MAPSTHGSYTLCKDLLPNMAPSTHGSYMLRNDLLPNMAPSTHGSYMLRKDLFDELSTKFHDTFEGFKQAAKLEAKNQAKASASKGKKKVAAGPADDGLGAEAELLAAMASACTRADY